MLATLAEFLHAAGEAFPPLGAEATAWDTDIAMEARHATVPRQVFEATHVWEDADPLAFLLSSPEPDERKYLDETPLPKLTNRALPRQLEILKGTYRRASWAMRNANLLAALVAPRALSSTKTGTALPL